MQDESLHEIQINGKQLVFLFMAATVVAVVIFLCGVMVGRGVPQRTGAASAAPEQVASDLTGSLQPVPTPLPVPSTGDAPLTTNEILTYPTRLGDGGPPIETLKPPLGSPTREPAPKPAVVAAAAKPTASTRKPPGSGSKPAVVPPPPQKAGPASGSATGPDATYSAAIPASSGFVVQVAAVRTRADAETIATRLGAKGYPTFITTAGSNFRVRVGKYGNRREAEAVAVRLEREERVVKPWITR
jgi:cell division protein FtsN